MCFQNIISYQYQIPLRCLYLYWQSQLFISNQKYLISYCTVELPDTTWYSHVFTNHIEVSKVSCLQWHVSSIELNMQLRDILNHLKPTAEAAASTSVFVHLILGQNTYMCFTTLGALPKHFFGFDIPSRSGQPQLSNLTIARTGTQWKNMEKPTYTAYQSYTYSTYMNKTNKRWLSLANPLRSPTVRFRRDLQTLSYRAT